MIDKLTNIIREMKKFAARKIFKEEGAEKRFLSNIDS